MMRVTFIALAVVLALVLPRSVEAQQWSPDEQAVLDQLAECWDFWMEGVEAGTPDRWMSECTTPDATYWPARDGAPSDNEFIRRNWETVTGRDLGWLDIRPVSLTVTDDIAVLHFYGLWRADGPDGPVVTEAKRTEIFRQMDGRWKLISGHGTPVTAADAEPYRGG